MKHEGFTPGPWYVRGSYGNVIAAEGREVAIASVNVYVSRGVSIEQSQIDAALIAAAPELYAENQRLRAALERAEVTLLSASRGRLTPDEINDAAYEARAAIAKATK